MKVKFGNYPYNNYSRAFVIITVIIIIQECLCLLCLLTMLTTYSNKFNSYIIIVHLIILK